MESVLLNEERWDAIWRALGLSAPAGWRERLLACYQNPQRHYHNLQHLGECLREFDGARALAEDPAAVELAIWFHDAVYDPRASDNEEQSAALSTECLGTAGAPEALRRIVAALVLATKHHVAATPDEALLIDIDLSILGQPRERFAEYEVQIRQEYSWVSERVFAEKRCEVLRRFLERSRIYHNELFFSRYETRTRENLSWSSERLCGGEM